MILRLSDAPYSWKLAKGLISLLLNVWSTLCLMIKVMNTKNTNSDCWWRRWSEGVNLMWCEEAGMCWRKTLFIHPCYSFECLNNLAKNKRRMEKKMNNCVVLTWRVCPPLSSLVIDDEGWLSVEVIVGIIPYNHPCGAPSHFPLIQTKYMVTLCKAPQMAKRYHGRGTHSSLQLTPRLAMVQKLQGIYPMPYGAYTMHHTCLVCPKYPYLL